MALFHPADLLGRPGAAVGRMSCGRFLRHGLGAICANIVAAGLCESGQRVQLLLGDAVPEALPHDV